MAQRRAIHWTLNNYSSYDSVSQMQTDLGWRSLDQRRADARLCMLYTIKHGLVAIQFPPYYQQPSRMTRHSHSLALRHSYFYELLQILCFSSVWQSGLLNTSYPRHNRPVLTCFKPRLLLTSNTFICFPISLLHIFTVHLLSFLTMRNQPEGNPLEGVLQNQYIDR